MKCENCGSTKSYVKDYEHKTKVKDKEVIYISPRRFCDNCNHLVFDESLDNEASKKAIEVYNKKYGIPKEDIINLRKKYNLTQEMFSKLIGCAKKTLISYEKGTSIPNDNFYITLKTLINNPQIIENFLEANKDEIDQKEYENIKERMEPFLNKNIAQALYKKEGELTEFNGYVNLDINKLENIILYFSKDGILKTKLLKEMFYADFINYKNTASSITGLEYVKLPHGPVPDGFENLLGYLVDQTIIDYKIEYSNNFDLEYHKIIGLKEFNESLFSNYELSSLKEVKNYFQNFKSKEIEEKSHQEEAYKKTEYCHKISYDYAFDINLKG